MRGHVAQPLRYPYKPGMRIRDLIPDREALISPDFYRRKNLLVQMIEDDETSPMRRLERRRATAICRATGAARARPRARLPAPRRVRGRAGAAQQLPGTGDRRQRRRRSDRRGATAPGDRLDATGTAARPQPRPTTTRPRCDARARAAAATLFDELNWDYAVIERLNRNDLTTQVIPFNLGKAILQGDEANNLALLPGDVVTVYSQKDIRVPVARQTRLVSLEGEVNSPGVYQLHARRDAEGACSRAPAASRRRPMSTASSSAARRRASASART